MKILAPTELLHEYLSIIQDKFLEMVHASFFFFFTDNRRLIVRLQDTLKIFAASFSFSSTSSNIVTVDHLYHHRKKVKGKDKSQLQANSFIWKIPRKVLQECCEQKVDDRKKETRVVADRQGFSHELM